MTVEVVFAIAGILFFIYGLIGRKLNIEIKDVKIFGKEPLSNWQRAVLSIFGIILILVAFTPIQTRLFTETPEATKTEIATANVTKSISSPTTTILPTDTSTIAPVPSFTSSPTLVQTAEVTASITPLPTQVVTPTLPSDGILFYDYFESNQNGWILGQQQLVASSQDRTISDGVYQNVMAFRKSGDGWGFVPRLEARDFHLSIDGKIPVSAIENPSSLAIAFRCEDDNYYLALFNTHGEYALALFKNYTWSFIHDWTTSDAFDLSDGKRNNFELYIVGTRIIFSVNQIKIFEIDDSSLLDSGRIGIGGYGTKDDTMIVEYDNLIILKP